MAHMKRWLGSFWPTWWKTPMPLTDRGAELKVRAESASRCCLGGFRKFARLLSCFCISALSWRWEIEPLKITSSLFHVGKVTTTSQRSGLCTAYLKMPSLDGYLTSFVKCKDEHYRCNKRLFTLSNHQNNRGCNNCFHTLLRSGVSR